jgi:Fic family protein
MLFATPHLEPPELEVIRRIDELRQNLRYQTAGRARWVGSLRRVSFARAVQASNSIEGYNVSLDDAVAVAEGEEPMDADNETWAAVRGYRDAMTYVVQLADDPYFSFNDALIKGLHFMMLSYDLSKYPGRWRPGAVYVRNEATGTIVYEGSDSSTIPGLIEEFVPTVAGPCEDPILVKAAMAHLNFVMIHPFKDGNGRMARCLQTLVLAREGILAPEFCSIEEYLGRNTQAYYDVLAEVGQGHWNPNGDSTPWVRFTLTAHYRQARTLLRRVREAERLWNLIWDEVSRDGLPERCIPGLLYISRKGRRLRRVTYQHLAEESELTDVSDAMATRDLKTLTDVGFLIPYGEKRGRYYVATERLQKLRAKAREPRALEDEDPFTEVS